jgi:hypothetical protein
MRVMRARRRTDRRGMRILTLQDHVALMPGSGAIQRGHPRGYPIISGG